jgi:SAM-dependent methyltransferase
VAERTPLTTAEIHEYWTRQARTHGSSHAASWTDRGAIDLEVREIVRRLANGDRVLDIGCGNGYSTVQFASHKNVSIRGLDYVPEMVAEAQARAAGAASQLAGRIEFAVGDLTALDEPSNAYDKVITVRVLINLGTWEAQRTAIESCARVAKPGGLLLLSEATIQGWQRLNAFRSEWDLPPISMPDFNTYLDEEVVVDALAGVLDLVEIANFSSTYFVGTRVIKPLLAEACGRAALIAEPDLHWNRWWSALPPVGDYGTQKLFVFRKR